MLQYNDLSDGEKRILREKLQVERISAYYLEDNNIYIMTGSELFEYIFLDEIKKLKDAINLINYMKETKVEDKDVNKTVMQILIESNDKVVKISDEIYVYKDI